MRVYLIINTISGDVCGVFSSQKKAMDWLLHKAVQEYGWTTAEVACVRIESWLVDEE